MRLDSIIRNKASKKGISFEEMAKQEKSIIKQWIEQGAKWENHWSFEPIEETNVPNNDSTWPQNEIDEFVLSSLIQQSISPSKPAEPESWLRRVSFDLTGLPPSTDRLEKFLQDPSPKAREVEIEHLLSTVDYAERMALLWLDGARYADSNGFQFDTARTMWPWRDWVIQAYSQNMPYDQFVREQVAGDLLPNPTQDQLIATGFNRNHGYTFEGGTIDEEYRVIYANDKTTTFGTLFLGLTLECTRCHDHKYDPLSMEDYYSMFAFFNTSAEDGTFFDGCWAKDGTISDGGCTKDGTVLGNVRVLKLEAEYNASSFSLSTVSNVSNTHAVSIPSGCSEDGTVTTDDGNVISINGMS